MKGKIGSYSREIFKAVHQKECCTGNITHITGNIAV
jgi:hypothetical protein